MAKKGSSRKRTREYAEPKRIKPIDALTKKADESKRQKLEADNVTTKEYESQHNQCIIENINIAYNHQQMKYIEKFPNGLLCDSSRYFTCSSRNILISRLRSKRLLTIEAISLTAREFATLQGNRWLNGLVIDSFTDANIDEWIFVQMILWEWLVILVCKKEIKIADFVQLQKKF